MDGTLIRRGDISGGVYLRHSRCCPWKVQGGTMQQRVVYRVSKEQIHAYSYFPVEWIDLNGQGSSELLAEYGVQNTRRGTCTLRYGERRVIQNQGWLQLSVKPALVLF
jgi:hypothetical protein